jgi:hypothetical protein
VPDASDACPNAAEDVDRFEDEDGCPDLDDDHDGVLDADDRCPTEPETINGRDDVDGCPDAGRGAWTASGTSGTPSFALTGTLRFAPDGSLPASEVSRLDQLAQWLRREPDPVGFDIEVPASDDARAAHLREALVARGVRGELVVTSEASGARSVRVTELHAPPAVHAAEVPTP